jgi:hypothetical protein
MVKLIAALTAGIVGMACWLHGRAVCEHVIAMIHAHFS